MYRESVTRGMYTRLGKDGLQRLDAITLRLGLEIGNEGKGKKGYWGWWVNDLLALRFRGPGGRAVGASNTTCNERLREYIARLPISPSLRNQLAWKATNLSDHKDYPEVYLTPLQLSQIERALGMYGDALPPVRTGWTHRQAVQNTVAALRVIERNDLAAQKAHPVKGTALGRELEMREAIAALRRELELHLENNIKE